MFEKEIKEKIRSKNIEWDKLYENLIINGDVEGIPDIKIRNYDDNDRRTVRHLLKQFLPAHHMQTEVQMDGSVVYRNKEIKDNGIILIDFEDCTINCQACLDLYEDEENLNSFKSYDIIPKLKF